MATGYTPNNTTVTIGFGVPADSSYFTPPGDGQEWIDEVTGRRYIRVKGVWLDGVGLSAAALLTAPTVGAVAQSFDRATATTADLTVITTGQLYQVQVPLAVGALATSVTWRSGETPAGASLTHAWSVILDSGLAVRAVSPDRTTATWAADTDVTFTFGTPYRITGVGPWYAGIMIAGSGTIPTLEGVADFDVENSTEPPILAAISTPTSVTVPPALATVQGALTPVVNKVWVGVA